MTKTIKLKNKFLSPVFQFLDTAVLKGKATRGRTQFMKRLEEKSEEYNESVKDIRKEYFQTDERGELVVVDDKYQWIDNVPEQELFQNDVNNLNEEYAEISFFEHSTKYESLFKALEEYDRELTGQEALGYSELMDAYEANEEEK